MTAMTPLPGNTPRKNFARVLALFSLLGLVLAPLPLRGEPSDENPEPVRVALFSDMHVSANPEEVVKEFRPADELLKVVRMFPQVKALFFGHTHHWHRSTLAGGLQLVNLPALGYGFDETQPVGWVAAEFRKNGVELTLHALAGNRKEDGKKIFIPWKRRGN